MKVDSVWIVVKEKGEVLEDVQVDEIKLLSVGSIKGYVVIDVRLGCVMWKVEQYYGFCSLFVQQEWIIMVVVWFLILVIVQ